MKSMKVQPGVILKEFNGKIPEGQTRVDNCVRVSGGNFRDLYNEVKCMSTKEYSNMRETHSYESSKLGDLIRNKRLIE